jgi:hypothetical protein
MCIGSWGFNIIKYEIGMSRNIPSNTINNNIRSYYIYCGYRFDLVIDFNNIWSYLIMFGGYRSDLVALMIRSYI